MKGSKIILPSIKLLSDVLNCKVLSVELEGKNIEYWYTSNNIKDADFKLRINRYELAYKCKEWATYKGYAIFSGRADKEFRWVARVHENRKVSKTSKGIFTSNIEPEAIFKACEWILEQQK